MFFLILSADLYAGTVSHLKVNVLTAFSNEFLCNLFTFIGSSMKHLVEMLFFYSPAIKLFIISYKCILLFW